MKRKFYPKNRKSPVYNGRRPYKIESRKLDPATCPVCKGVFKSPQGLASHRKGAAKGSTLGKPCVPYSGEAGSPMFTWR